MADCCLIKKVATVEVYENKNEVRAYGFMAGDRNTPVMEVRFKHLWGESNLSTCKLRWIIVDDVGSLLVGEVPIQSDNTALINLPNELFTGDRRMKVQLTVASCDGSRILNLQQFTDLKVINSLAPNEVVEPVYQILINQLYDETQKYLSQLDTLYTSQYGSLENLYLSAKANLEQYLVTAENGGNAEFLQGYSPVNFIRSENTINELVNSATGKYKVGDVVEVLGYYTAGDGSHHKRIAKNEDDGSGELGQNGIWWCVVRQQTNNWVWFGVKLPYDSTGGDDENTNKMQRYIDWCCTPRGGAERMFRIDIPAGRWACSKPLILPINGVHVRGAGINLTYFDYQYPVGVIPDYIFYIGKDNTGEGISVTIENMSTQSAKGFVDIKVANQQMMTFRNLDLDGSRVTTPNFPIIASYGNFQVNTIENVVIKSGEGVCLGTKGFSNANSFYNCSFSGKRAIDFAGSSEVNNFYGCRFESGGSDGQVFIYVRTQWGMMFNGCYFENVQKILYQDQLGIDNSLVFDSCHFTGTSLNGKLEGFDFRNTFVATVRSCTFNSTTNLFSGGIVDENNQNGKNIKPKFTVKSQGGKKTVLLKLKERQSTELLYHLATIKIPFSGGSDVSYLSGVVSNMSGIYSEINLGGFTYSKVVEASNFASIRGTGEFFADSKTNEAKIELHTEYSSSSQECLLFVRIKPTELVDINACLEISFQNLDYVSDGEVRFVMNKLRRTTKPNFQQNTVDKLI